MMQEKLFSSNRTYDRSLRCFAIIATMVVIGCSSEAPKENRRFQGQPNNNAEQQKDNGTTKDSGKKPISGGSNSNTNDNSNDNSSNSQSNVNSNNNQNSNSGDRLQLSGKDYFEDIVTPLFRTPYPATPHAKKACDQCHAGPRVTVDNGGLEIFEYEHMRGYLVEAKHPTNNELMRRVTNYKTNYHTGGDRCGDPFTAHPVCRALLEWYEIEMGVELDLANISPPVDSSLVLNFVDKTGRAKGVAVDPADPTGVVTVRLYINGDKDSGVTPITVQADRETFTPDGAHGFQYTFEDKRDGVKTTLYAYAMIDGVETQLVGSPLEFHAYPKQAKATYDSGVGASFQGSCGGGCHQRNYDGDWEALLRPTPAEGGSDTNNYLYRKITGAISHDGGTFNGLAQPLRDWYNAEFGAIINNN